MVALLKGWLGGVLAALVALGVVLAIWVSQQGEPEEVATQVEVMPPVEAAPTPTPDPDPTPAPIMAPAFDVVRVSPEGSAVVAGHAGPGAEVQVLVEGEEAMRAKADAGGNFVAMFDMELADVPRVMQLRVAVDGRAPVLSEESFIVEPMEAPVEMVVIPTEQPEPAGEEVASAAPPNEPTTEPIAEPVGAEPVGEPLADTVTQPAEAPAPQTEEPPQAPRVLRADREGIAVMDAGGAATKELALDTITYDDGGEVEVAGRAQEEGSVRLYLDNNAVAEAPVEPDGRWELNLPDEVEQGVYTLRVDELDPEGTVRGRVESPFKREDPVALAERQATPEAAPVQAITVQPGSTLWAIARDRYGEGTLYVQVFEANRDKIRDPDLIYPGQVFDLPQAAAE